LKLKKKGLFKFLIDFQIDKIILIGDSAGGNLVTVLTSLCILH
jgi:hypothetical protein